MCKEPFSFLLMRYIFEQSSKETMFSTVAVGGGRKVLADLTLMARKPYRGKLTEDFSFVFWRFRRVYMHPPYWLSHILKSF